MPWQFSMKRRHFALALHHPLTAQQEPQQVRGDGSTIKKPELNVRSIARKYSPMLYSPFHHHQGKNNCITFERAKKNYINEKNENKKKTEGKVLCE